jgi:putative secretion ATPase (PEP-CTERM system associated)
VYEKYFQLRERPFALSPDPEYLYPSKVHQEALSYLRYGIEGHAGFVAITGEIGSGKTTMLQSLLGRLDRNTTVARIVNTMLDPRELLDAIMLDFGMDPTGIGKPVLLHRLAEFLVAQRQAGRLTLLVIDEAQNLSLPALEEIRMLSNLETEKSKLLQIIMIGQPELREKLALPQLQQLRQRITVSYHLTPLDADETANYVNHRLRRAALGPAVEFPRDVTDLIHQRSRGVPRIINVIADATLLFAYGVDRRNIDTSITQEALAELDATGVLAAYAIEATTTAPAVSSFSVAETQEALRIADEVRRREQELVVRERQLREREQQVAAQQRVVEEEAKILAAARARAAEAVSATPNPAGATSNHAGAGSTSAGATPNSAPAASAARVIAPGASVASRVAPAAGAASQIAPPASAAASHVALPLRSQMAPIPSGATRVAPAVRNAVPRYSAPAKHTITPSGVRVQRYTPPVREGGFWASVRRVLFGISEPETGA